MPVKTLLLLCLLSVLLLLGPIGTRATVPPSALPPRPNPARFLNDLAGVLTG